jgi:Clr5 domain
MEAAEVSPAAINGIKAPSPPQPPDGIADIDPVSAVQRITTEQWESLKSAVYQVYILQKKPLPETIREMKARYGFHAT